MNTIVRRGRVSLSNCDKCWETPCVCASGRGYRHLSVNELRAIQQGVTALINDKVRRGVDPDKREHQYGA